MKYSSDETRMLNNELDRLNAKSKEKMSIFVSILPYAMVVLFIIGVIGMLSGK